MSRERRAEPRRLALKSATRRALLEARRAVRRLERAVERFVGGR